MDAYQIHHKVSVAGVIFLMLSILDSLEFIMKTYIFLEVFFITSLQIFYSLDRLFDLT